MRFFNQYVAPSILGLIVFIIGCDVLERLFTDSSGQKITLGLIIVLGLAQFWIASYNSYKKDGNKTSEEEEW